MTFLIGILLEKIRIPWIFSALLIGLGLAAYNPFSDITNSGTFIFLAQLGMYFLLFMIGFELDIKNILKQGKFIVKTTIAIILAETLGGAILIHYIFNTSWLISFLVGASFATVGEAILLPILDEFKLTKTKLGQSILGVGVLDDVVELGAIILASVVVGKSMGATHFHFGLNLFLLCLLFGLVYVLIKFHKKVQYFKFKDISSLFIFILFFMFLFIGIGSYVESAALGAILAGIALKNMIPKEKLKLIDSEIKTISYGFFSPLFFLWVGLDTDLSYLIKFPLLIILILVMTNATKILASYFVGKKELGVKKSIVMGISLTVKFSTSIVIIKFLYDGNIINSALYSVLIGTTILSQFIIPLLLSTLITKWKIGSSRKVSN